MPTCLENALAVHCADDGRLLGYAAKVTDRGLSLTTETPLDLHREYDLELVIAATDVQPQQTCRVRARCMWVGTDARPRRCLAGFEFLAGPVMP
jgi:hypothetical protein